MPRYAITDSFDKDFGVDEWHGHNVFFRDGERIFRTDFTITDLVAIAATAGVIIWQVWFVLK